MLDDWIGTGECVIIGGFIIGAAIETIPATGGLLLLLLSFDGCRICDVSVGLGLDACDICCCCCGGDCGSGGTCWTIFVLCRNISNFSISTFEAQHICPLVEHLKCLFIE